MSKKGSDVQNCKKLITLYSKVILISTFAILALKMKLMVRRPMTTLVEQGILPSPKTSPALYEQKQKLERAKKADLLKSKIAKRPDRQELVHRHILEDVRPGVDPSLCDKQRQLKRAKLADSLSNQLLTRPGPLELIQKNILHTDDNVEQAVKEGQIQFKPTNEGVLCKPIDLIPSKYSIDEDSNSEGGVQSPPDFMTTSVVSPVSSTFVPLPLPAVSVKERISAINDVIKSESHDTIFPTPKSSELKRRASDVGIANNMGSPPHLSSSSSSTSASVTSLNNRPASLNLTYSRREAPGKEVRKNKIKVKPKSNSVKPRTIKFHEYKVRIIGSLHVVGSINESNFYYRDHKLLIKGEVVMTLSRKVPSRKNHWTKIQHPMNCF